MDITIINRSTGEVRAHRSGCRDIERETRQHFLNDSFEFGEFDTKASVWVEYNADFIDEGGQANAYDIDFAPCCDALPEGDKADYLAATTSKED